MQWPWVSRKAHADCNVQWHLHCLALERRIQAYQKALDMEEARRRDEQWRRIKAEGHVAYMQDRITRVLGLPIWPGDAR